MRHRVNKPQVILEAFDDEIVIVNLETGAYYSLAGAGAELWDLVSQGRSNGEIVDALARRYASERSVLETEVDRFVRELVDEKLVSSAADANGFSAATNDGSHSSNTRSAFAVPVLQKFTDMEDLILLDPIHEVDETGWPAPKRADGEPHIHGGTT